MKYKKDSLGKVDFENLLTIDELLACLKYQYSKSTVYHWVGEGIPHFKIRGKLWFNKEEIFKWLLHKN